MKKFVIYWDETYYKEQVKLVERNQFTTEFGFDTMVLFKLDLLDIGESMSVDAKHVLIMRVK